MAHTLFGSNFFCPTHARDFTMDSIGRDFFIWARFLPLRRFFVVAPPPPPSVGRWLRPKPRNPNPAREETQNPSVTLWLGWVIPPLLDLSSSSSADSRKRKGEKEEEEKEENWGMKYSNRQLLRRGSMNSERGRLYTTPF